MDAELLLHNFPLIISRAEDVPRLNEAILQLAVQGKLVPQDPDDEPASELLKRIVAQKERLGIKSKKLPEIGEEERPYTLPDGWLWVRLPEIYHGIGQKKPVDKFTYIDVSSIDNINGKIGDDLSVIEPEDAPSRARKLIKNGTVIYSTVRPYLLNIAIVNREFDPEPVVSTAFAIMHPFKGVYNRFLFYYLRSRTFIDFVESQMTGMAYPAISDSKLNKGLFPLPPLPEQKRIVARVDTLLAQTRQLEASLAEAQQSLTTLHSAAAQELLSATGPDDFAAKWQFIRANFDALYDEAYPQAALANIAQLKQTILQLAVQGKLTRQDPSDEPAALLLQRIAAEKERLVAEKKIRKSKPLPEIGEEERPYALPDGWKWCYIDDIALKVTDGEHSTPRRSDSGYYLLSARNVTNEGIKLTKVDYVEADEFKRIRKRCDPEKDDILISCSGSVGRVAIVDKDNAYVMVRSLLCQHSMRHSDLRN